jgi:RNA polymerase sigma-B factor
METLSMEKVSRRRNARPATPPTPGGATMKNLDRLDDAALLRIVRSQPAASPRRAAATELLITRHRALVRACVARYNHSPEPAEDLTQVGYVGLLKAINNFDPGLGGSLAAYAQPCISGEIKRHFRDKRWQVHVERSTQELVLRVREATRALTQDLGRQPADHELAEHLAITETDLRDARRADLVFTPASLDAPLPGQPDAATLADVLGADDPAVEHALDMHALAAHWGELPRREQKILLLRFYADMTQADIGQQLGISQMHVSRLLAHALGHLRHRLLATDAPAPRQLAKAS